MNRTAKAILAATTIFTVAGCSTAYNTGINKAAVEYDGYHIIKSDPTFQQCIDPGKAGRDGHATIFHYYPVDQSHYTFSEDGSADTKPLAVVSKDNVTMYVSGQATFVLNFKCSVLEQFDKTIGTRYLPVLGDSDGDATGGGDTGDKRNGNWSDLLAATLKQPLEKSLDQASKQYGYEALYSDPDVKTQWQLAVGRLLAANLKAQVGNDYFCAPTFTARQGEGCGDITLTLQSPVPPSNLRDALTGKQQAILDNQTQQQKNTTQLTSADGIRFAMRRLGLHGAAGFAEYIEYLAVQGGQISILPIPQGTNLTLPAKP